MSNTDLKCFFHLLAVKLSSGRRIISNIFRKTFRRLINHLNIKATGGGEVTQNSYFSKEEGACNSLQVSSFNFQATYIKCQALLHRFQNVLSRSGNMGLWCLEFKPQRVPESSKDTTLLWRYEWNWVNRNIFPKFRSVVVEFTSLRI